jgi:hypothetical protein
MSTTNTYAKRNAANTLAAIAPVESLIVWMITSDTMDKIAFGEADLRRTLAKYGITIQVFHTCNGDIVEMSDGTLRYELDAVEV